MSLTNKDVPACGDHCKALVDVLARVGDKWTIMIVGLLSNGPLRYNQIRRQIGAISQRMLTLSLKGLEADGLVNRTLYPSVPPRVDYELTELGHSLKASLDPLHRWAAEHQATIASARQEYVRTRLINGA